ALAVLPLPLAVALIGGSAFALALLLRPILGLYALVLAIPFNPLLRVSLGPAAVGATDLLIAATALAWFMQFTFRISEFGFRNTLQPVPLLWLLLPFYLVLIFSTLAAQSLEQAIPEIIKWTEVLVVYFLGAQMLEQKHRLTFALTILAAGSIEAMVGLRQFFFRIGPEAYQLGAFLRAYGTFGQPNPYAGYLGLALPLGLALSLWASENAWKERRRSGHAVRSLLLASLTLGLTAIVLAGIVASWSRGAWLGVLVSTLTVLALYSLSGRMLILLGVLAGIIAMPLFPAAITNRLTDIARYFGTWNARSVPVTDENFSVLERVAHWQVAWEMLADHPILGIGVGNWDVRYPAYAFDHWRDSLGHAHNALFHYAAVAGFLGALSYLWLWLGSLVAAFRSILRSVDLNRAVAIGVLGLLVHLSIHNLIDNLWVQGMPLLFALALSLLPSPRAQA
ncbi:MAG: O-antigen ligase family protein, partial [Caldilineales bacterium]|nr:O-antigen ligase family protein [Caldilineales bacterium]